MERPTQVLIIDDSDLVRQTIRNVLLGFDCEFSEAADGLTALRLLQASRFDITFLDLKLSGASGLDILRQARELRAELGEVIIVTGAPDPRTVCARADDQAGENWGSLHPERD